MEDYIFEIKVEKGNLKLKDIAQHMGISLWTISRWMNEEGAMTDVRAAQVKKAIKEMKKKAAAK